MLKSCDKTKSDVIESAFKKVAAINKRIKSLEESNMPNFEKRYEIREISKMIELLENKFVKSDI